jgi:hypothetical protein
MWKIFITALGIRILVSYLASKLMLPGSNYDINSYLFIGNRILHGDPIYPTLALGHYPYFPLILYPEAFIVWLTRFNIPADMGLRVLFSIFDAGIIWPLAIITKSRNISWSYAINPVTILITSVQAQFDAIPVFFLLWSIVWWQQQKLFRFYLFGSLAIAVKTWPLIFLLPFIFQKYRIKSLIYLSVIPILSTILYCLLFRQNPFDVLITVVKYHGVAGNWGFSFVLGKIFPSIYVMSALSVFFTFLLLIISYRNRHRDIISQIIILMFIFFIFTPTFGTQWLLWIIPFILLSPISELALFFFLAGIYLTLTYAPLFGVKPLTFFYPVSGFAVWFYLGYLFWKYYYRIRF